MVSGPALGEKKRGARAAADGARSGIESTIGMLPVCCGEVVGTDAGTPGVPGPVAPPPPPHAARAIVDASMAARYRALIAGPLLNRDGEGGGVRHALQRRRSDR